MGRDTVPGTCRFMDEETKLSMDPQGRTVRFMQLTFHNGNTIHIYVTKDPAFTLKHADGDILNLWRYEIHDGLITLYGNGSDSVHAPGVGHEFVRGWPMLEEWVNKKIIVNAIKQEWGDTIRYMDVVELAHPGCESMLTVMYSRGPPANREGLMVEGDTVELKDGMVFDVTDTSKA